jgi:hypothetical protein
VFAVLVAFKVHGSSIALPAQTWDPKHAMDHFVAKPLLDEMSDVDRAKWRSKLMAVPRNIRVDEWSHSTPWALAQFHHRPLFPVVNENIGDGANMLVSPWVPVLHPSLLGRPVTWGYLLFGAQSGLAWAWWYQPFACFIALSLLLNIILKGRKWLALFGAAWFCASAYVICWSLWPAYLTAFGAFSLVLAYYLLTGNQRYWLLASGVWLGASFAGFVMDLYPPWQIPLAHVFLFIFIGLLIRDRPWRKTRNQWRYRLVGLGLALLVAAMTLGSFYVSTASVLHDMANTVYPGQRRLLGGDCSATRLFGAFYNYATIYRTPSNSNESESAGYFLLFPAVFIAAIALPRVRRGLGVIGWLLLGLAGFFVYFCVTPVPEWLATITLMSRVQGYRSQIALGLVSIILSMQLLAAMHRCRFWEERTLSAALLVFLGCFGLFVWLGWYFQMETNYFGGGSAMPPREVLVIAALAGAMGAVLTLGLAEISAVLILGAAVITASTFNPVSRGFTPLEETEMGQAIADVLENDPHPMGKPSLWLTYGGNLYPSMGMVAQMFGARSIAGVHQHPQLEMWHKLDPNRANFDLYNRYALVLQFAAPPSDPTIFFNLPHMFVLHLKTSPLNPIWKNLGARYVISNGPPSEVTQSNLTSIYQSTSGTFGIWQLPESMTTP